MRYVYPICGTPGDIAIQKREIDYIKIEIVPFIGNCTIRYTKIQIQKRCLGIERINHSRSAAFERLVKYY